MNRIMIYEIFVKIYSISDEIIIEVIENRQKSLVSRGKPVPGSSPWTAQPLDPWDMGVRDISPQGRISAPELAPPGGQVAGTPAGAPGGPGNRGKLHLVGL